MGRYRNPILPGCHPDPSICRLGDRYLLVTSTFEYLPGLPVHASTNLVDWELVGHAIHREEQLDLRGLDGSSGLYAPTIRVVGGRLVVVCTVVGSEEGPWSGRTGHFLVTAEDPAGPWSDPVWIDGVGGFDPSITVDGDRVWLCGTRLAAAAEWPGRTEVWIAELDLESGALRGEPVPIWTGAAARAVWAEGPHVLPRPGGGWMLLAAEGGTDLDHAVVTAYAEEITGPYTGDTGNPRLTHRDLGSGAEIVAVGHADLVDTPAGETWAVALGSHPVAGRRGLLGRRTSLVPVGWEGARPLFAPGTARVAPVVEAPGVPDAAPWPSLVVDDFDGVTLDPAWNGVGRMPQLFADPVARPGHVRLRAGDDPGTVGLPAFLGRRLPSERTRVEATVATVPGEGTLRAGLLLRVGERQLLELAVDRGGEVVLARVQGGLRAELARGRVAASGPVLLGLEIVDLVAAASVDGVPLASVDVAGLAPLPPRGFVGAWVGPFAAGDGFVDVDRVVLETLPGV
ncbi:glycoside hydrolase family 43 protein [Microbacterium sp. SORGH_AS_0888]|uniref:glycoside hydrolase family 43 protein n=1 Tax=Microbacterium sp. SORGH_AS_0888 TaxID=3041791 RepID=UPI0027811EA5|nr:glycoside hydrolase family 43 protein [Microbacterium sp. SORGH_AS_0888]MDQ1129451.1 xylan 1,4-beta-xylosidase [Microbacterium sp. SORGH_AS_0888]